MPKRRAPAVMGVIILVVAVLVGFFGMRAFYKSEQSEAQKPSVMVTASKLVLKASPSDTMVISAIDGRNLGKTPLNLMVPTDTSPVVLLAAKGHQPQRLVLPDRGQLGISLFAQESEPEPCLIDVVAEGAVLEGFLSNIEKNKSLSIPGAAVVKARRGRAQGAWLLRCPPSGKPKRLQPQTPTEVRMKINAPEGAKLYVDGGSAGTIPTEITVESGFHEVRVEDGEDSAAWWVPALVNVEMSLDL